MADDTLTMFGKTYNTVGSANTNLMLQTKGDLKIRWGNKFIDLVKNGKINAESDVLKTADSSDSINTDGIYLVKNGEKDEIWVRVNKTSVNLTREVVSEFISYKEELKLSGEERQMALSNIGIVFDTYANLSTSGIKNGFAYVVENLKFFLVIDGKISEYNFETKVGDPLEIGNIIIQGSTEEILGKTRLSVNANNAINLKISGLNVIIVDGNKVTYSQYISSNKGILSFTYNDSTGFFVGIDSQNKAIGVFDEIIVRNGINTVKQVTYKQLASLLKSKALITNVEYIITDFLDVRNVTYDNDVVLLDSFDTYKNVYPIVIKAKNQSELEPLGYFLDNPNWIVEYDPNFYYIIKYEYYLDSNTYNIAYSKGRITKMTDEFGNVANFDFKHSTFTNENKYLFNVANPRIKELNKLIELTPTDSYIAERDRTNIYADASLDIDVLILVDNGEVVSFERVRNTSIVNNTIYLAEPVIAACEASTSVKMATFSDYIIFNDCSILTPNNNTINNVTGKYKILKQFEGNTFDSLVYEDSDEYQTLPVLTNNTAGIIYLKDSYGETVFNTTSIYNGNTFGNISKTTFYLGLTNNSFKNLENVIIDNLIDNNVFELDLLNLHIMSPSMLNNVFKGLINTYTDIETYIINGTLINNVFEGDLEGVSFNSTCIITNNKFNGDITYLDSTYTIFKGEINRCLFGQISGCTFETNSLLYNTVFYNEELFLYSNMELVTIDKTINNSLFKGDIINTHLYEDINRLTSEGIIGNDNTVSTLGEITSTTFNVDVLDIISKDSIISNSTFDGLVNGCTITGNIDNCIFTGLSGNIQITGPLNTVEIWDSMTPNTASYVEDSNNTYIPNLPFIISVLKIPKLSISGKKTCTVATKVYNNNNVLVFMVKTLLDDYTPSGVIVMFNGLADQIPSGWAICDGTKGTPDLRGRFIRMIEANEAAGAKNNSDLETNGNGTRLAYLKKAIKHTHTFKTYNTNLTADLTNFSIDYASAHSLGVDTSNLSVSINEKTLTYTTYDTSSATKVIDHIVTDSSSTTFLASEQNSTDLKHDHTGSISGNVTISGSLPGITYSGDIKVPINYTPEQETTENGFVEAVNVEPLAYALIFIMKL